MEETTKHPHLELEYTQINENFRFLAEVRFKLLAFVPSLGGAAVFVLARAGLEAGTAPASSNPELLVVLLVSLFGFLATLGVTWAQLASVGVAAIAALGFTSRLVALDRQEMQRYHLAAERDSINQDRNIT